MVINIYLTEEEIDKLKNDEPIRFEVNCYEKYQIGNGVNVWIEIRKEESK